MTGSDPAQASTRDADSRAKLRPEDALRLLTEGNNRFVTGRTISGDYALQVAQTSSGQYPFAVILGCVDSRVPPEVVFDQGIGDILSARVAGNVLNDDIIGSIEFATAMAGAKLVLILGHTECGAVKGACDGVELGHLSAALRKIAPAVSAVATDGPRNSTNRDFINAVARENVRMSIRSLLERSQVVRNLAEEDKVLVVGAMYDVATGRVSVLESGDSSSST